MLENERVLVQGGAGSGKTVIAAEAARRLAAQGRRVLLLCFTAPLRRFLEQRLDGTGIDVQTINGFAKQVEVQVGPTPGEPNLQTDDGWAALFRHVAPYVEPRWDAVVVDEAQDLQAGGWELVERLSVGKRLWAFHDAAQKFWLDRQVPDRLFTARYRLLRQQRSPPGILALAQRSLGLEFDAAALAAAVAEGIIRTIVSPKAGVAAAIGTEIDRLLAGGLHPGDIGVVSLRGSAVRNSRARDVVRFGTHEAVRADADDARSRLVADTFLRWKGLERPAMIVTNLPASPLSQLPLRLNIALTRATVAVSLAGTTDALRRIELE
jgi:superfamily I DNA and RNA helicase